MRYRPFTGNVVSNQMVIGFALDCTAKRLDEFCDKVDAIAADRAKAAKPKAFNALKAELEADGSVVKTEVLEAKADTTEEQA